ncbi:MAG: hypothetical protein ABIN39_02380 [candidate division WOR-3 bacterium]
MKSEIIKESIEKLFDYLEKNDYKGYDPFDGLNSFLYPFTFKNKFLSIALQQSVRRLPFNIRPFIGIKKERSTKGIAYIASSYLKYYKLTQNKKFLERAEELINWVIQNRSPYFDNYSWGNHFDYVSRVFYLKKGMPTVVWTGLIGSILVEFFLETKKEVYQDAIFKTAKFILEDLPTYDYDHTFCISYIPFQKKNVHNANVIGGSFLAQAKKITGIDTGKLERLSMEYTARFQHEDGSWYYGERKDLHWIDNFHTAYVLDSFKRYQEFSGDNTFKENIKKGFDYYRKNFFDGDIPKYYFSKTYPIDIQCVSQSIETLANFNDIEKSYSVALWAIKNMQEKDGHFIFRKYRKIKNKTPMLHWGLGTMARALTFLLEKL